MSYPLQICFMNNGVVEKDKTGTYQKPKNTTTKQAMELLKSEEVMVEEMTVEEAVSRHYASNLFNMDCNDGNSYLVTDLYITVHVDCPKVYELKFHAEENDSMDDEIDESDNTMVSNVINGDILALWNSDNNMICIQENQSRFNKKVKPAEKYDVFFCTLGKQMKNIKRRKRYLDTQKHLLALFSKEPQLVSLNMFQCAAAYS